MVILADSSIWIDHFRKPQNHLPQLIDRGQLAIHSFVICELALGSVPDRERLVAYLQSFPTMDMTDPRSLLDFVRANDLHGKGIGLVDAALLMACFENKLRLWTGDKRLLVQAERLGLAYQP